MMECHQSNGALSQRLSSLHICYHRLNQSRTRKTTVFNHHRFCATVPSFDTESRLVLVRKSTKSRSAKLGSTPLTNAACYIHYILLHPLHEPLRYAMRSAPLPSKDPSAIRMWPAPLSYAAWNAIRCGPLSNMMRSAPLLGIAVVRVICTVAQRHYHLMSRSQDSNNWLVFVSPNHFPINRKPLHKVVCSWFGFVTKCSI